MLTAKDALGCTFTLPVTAPSDMLQIIRKGNFFCPCCNGGLILKAGSIKIPHFAHKSNHGCNASSEPESLYHLLGKRKLFNWLLSRGIYAELECYLPEIRQRADILAIIGDIKYAIEFQCSSISQAEFEKRTNSYRSAGIFPVWLLSEKWLEHHSGFSINITSFTSLFMKGTAEAPYLLSYSPLENRLFIRRNLSSISSRKWLGEFAAFYLDGLPPKMTLPLQTPSWFNEWWKSRERWLMAITTHGSIHKNFLFQLYTSGLSPASLPAEIGIPVSGSHLIETAAIQWQALIYIGTFKKVPVNGIVSAGVVKKCFSRHINKGDIRLRSFPLMEAVHPWIPVIKYFELLETAGYMEKISGSAWRKRKDFTILETKDEQKEFSLKWNVILKNHWQTKVHDFSDYFPLLQ
ncbi:competence protein CoiA [Bacillus sp. M6-12]|uniref:competence protein CoiA n=1 Tax=Bacillus sp. M6-12 TaxID=2054166 RepID=UPI0015E086EB|nr:competence protein CoiA family protein [Bacillus sp. M6-12]